VNNYISLRYTSDAIATDVVWIIYYKIYIEMLHSDRVAENCTFIYHKFTQHPLEVWIQKSATVFGVRISE